MIHFLQFNLKYHFFVYKITITNDKRTLSFLIYSRLSSSIRCETTHQEIQNLNMAVKVSMHYYSPRSISYIIYMFTFGHCHLMIAYSMESIEKTNIAAPRLMRRKEKGAKVKARKILGLHQSRKKPKTTLSSALKIRTEKK